MDLMTDAVAQFRAASEAGDASGMIAALSPDAILISPLSGRMVFRGHGDLKVLLGAVYGAVGEMRWSEEFGDGSRRVVIGEGRIGPLRLGDAMVLELDPAGLIRTVRPHLRPWLALTTFAIMLAPKMVAHPGVIWRALRTR